MSHIKAIIAGQIFTPLEEIPDDVVIVEGSRIARVGRRGEASILANPATVDHRDSILIPGMIDQHIHATKADLAVLNKDYEVKQTCVGGRPAL